MQLAASLLVMLVGYSVLLLMKYCLRRRSRFEHSADVIQHIVSITIIIDVTCAVMMMHSILR